MRIFVPGVPDEDAASVWERMREARRAPEDTRPLYSITYDDETEVLATVVEEGVIAIVAGEAFYKSIVGSPKI